MSYSVKRLLEIFRSEVDDTVEEYLWADDDFVEYLDEAQKEFARKTDYFKDASSAITTLPVVADDPWVAYSPRITDFRRVTISGRSTPLTQINFNELEQHFRVSAYGEELSGNWDTSVGTPRYAVMDIETDKIRLVPIPSQSGTLNLTIFRLPLLDITSLNDDLELTDSIHQRSLLMFCKAMAYMKHDSETYDPDRAEKHRADFYGYCAELKKGQTRKQRRIGTVRYGGY